MYETVRPGDKGDVVVQIQDCLVQFGYMSVVNGIYDDTTTAAVKEFQKEHKLKVDGICGSETLGVLFGY